MTWADPIPRAYGMPLWANYIARDRDGKTYLYEHEPYWNPDRDYFDLGKGNALGGRGCEIYWPAHYEPQRGVIAHIKEPP